MADILKISTPLINKNQAVQPKSEIQPMTPFDLQTVNKVMQPHGQSEILKQNNGMIQQGDTPTILQNLLKDPAVTVSYLHNIFMLEEIIKLLPANNKTVTEEIEQLFQALLVHPGEVAEEMVRQEGLATVFRGPLYDFLRQVSDQSPPGSEIQGVISNLLRSLNHLIGNRDALDAVANSLQFLKNNLRSSQSLSEKLAELIQRIRNPQDQQGQKQSWDTRPENRMENRSQSFGEIKREALELLKEVGESILFSPKMEKVVSITIYNLSRYNDNTDYLRESSSALVRLLNGENRQIFRALLNEYLNTLDEGNPRDREISRVMDTLIKLIGTQADTENPGLPDSGKIEKIIHSMLSSPCNFTPLLHFVVPVLFEDIKAFAEIWINPNDEEDSREGAQTGIHMLLVIDIETEGRFEAELFVKGKVIDFSLFCPQGYEQKYQQSMSKLSAVVAGLHYRFGNVRVEQLDHSRSLMEVFKTLPYKRAGVDVKI